MPKTEGGLEVLNLQTQNKALLLKYLDSFFNKTDIPWVHLIWEKYYRNGKLPYHTMKGSIWWRNKGLALVNVCDESTCDESTCSINVLDAKSINELAQLFHLPFIRYGF